MEPEQSDYELLTAYLTCKANNPIPHDVLRVLYRLHNTKWPDFRQQNMNCGGCVRRVFTRVENYLKSLNLI